MSASAPPPARLGCGIRGVAHEPQTGADAAGVFTVMLPLPPNGVALAVGAATSLVRTAHVGPLRLVMSDVPVDVRPTITPAQTTTAPMMLMMNARVFMVTPMFAYRPRCGATVRRREPRWRILSTAASTLRVRRGIPLHRLVQAVCAHVSFINVDALCRARHDSWSRPVRAGADRAGVARTLLSGSYESRRKHLVEVTFSRVPCIDGEGSSTSSVL
jgi:hypothetical protein